MRSPSGRVPQQGLNRLWLASICAITVATLSGSFVTPAFGAPAKLDGIAPPPESPFPLEAQPTQFSDAIAAALNIDNGEGDGGVEGFVKNQPSAVDSYGNPIETLKPIDTPDGRKVISAQGLQFEIPNYASGITEIKKPSDDLLPPLIAPFEPTSTSDSADSSASTEQDFGSSTKTTFSKSNEGKVITNNVFGTSSGVTTASKQVGFGASTAAGQANFQKDFQQNTSDRFSTTGSSFVGTSNAFNKAATPSAFSSFSSAQQNTNFNSFNNKGPVTNADTGKYTGGFGGSPGILGSGKIGSAVRTDGSIRPTSNVAFTQATAIPPTAPPKFPTNPNFANRVGNSASTSFTANTAAGANKYQGTFGGPPGVLNPFDNIKSG
uniref:Uncharacterized protein n=1 Tax=Zeugodacus cucurbitae TaxID=28588 RepID=A0A0A1XBC8_ZEUCU